MTTEYHVTEELESGTDDPGETEIVADEVILALLPPYELFCSCGCAWERGGRVVSEDPGDCTHRCHEVWRQMYQVKVAPA